MSLFLIGLRGAFSWFRAFIDFLNQPTDDNKLIRLDVLIYVLDSDLIGLIGRVMVFVDPAPSTPKDQDGNLQFLKECQNLFIELSYLPPGRELEDYFVHLEHVLRVIDLSAKRFTVHAPIHGQPSGLPSTWMTSLQRQNTTYAVTIDAQILKSYGALSMLVKAVWRRSTAVFRASIETGNMGSLDGLERQKEDVFTLGVETP
ncbi:unnamed protein product [Rhizoctonia solani]|uniref:Uncharacterized protein n=1 Tax=Rhizoctonia solani TaxID=456999 RepID=A0A8H3E8J9_9AGAM|nr:unnamed protein product [Rhizoctonia solani]